MPKSSLKLFLRYGTVIGFCGEHTPFFTHAASKIRRAFDRRTVNYHRCRGNDCQPRDGFSGSIRDRPHVFVAACQFLHLADAKLPPRVKRIDVRRVRWERLLTRFADAGF